MCNILAHVGQRQKTAFAARLKQIWLPPNREAVFFKSLLDEIKTTWRNIFSQIQETFAENLFRMNV